MGCKVYIISCIIVVGLVAGVIGCKSSDIPVKDAAVEVAQYGVPFSGVPDPVDVCMYEINERAFSEAGTFAGIEARLDSVKALGINTIWLMPIHPVGKVKSAGGLGSPYAVANYLEVNPEFGTLESLRSLVAKAHQLGMAVILDFVANHTAWDNPWIANRSWYVQDSKGEIIIPPGTNWQDVAELNYSNKEMRAAMISAMKYWILTANVDGYRFDAADLVPADFWREATSAMNAIPNRKIILLAEGSSSEIVKAGMQMNYSWDFYTAAKNVIGSGQSATGLNSAHRNEMSNLLPGKYKLRFTTNHDECAWDNSPVTIFKSLKASVTAFVVSTYTGGVPLVYNGQEVGVPDKIPFFTKSPINWSLNPETKQIYTKLLQFRNSSNAVKKGSYAFFESVDIFACKRQYGTEQVLILANVHGLQTNYSVPAELTGSTWTNVMDGSMVTLGATMPFQPNQFFILKKN